MGMLIVLTFAIAALFTILAVISCLLSGITKPAPASSALAGPACVASHAGQQGRRRGARCGQGARLRR